MEEKLAGRERDLFKLKESIILYDPTNTYFEGRAAESENALHGRSKEKRSDCPLVTLALVLDEDDRPAIVIDAGMAAKVDRDKIKAKGFHYLSWPTACRPSSSAASGTGASITAGIRSGPDCRP